MTGGAGYVGSHAVKALRQAGHEVVIYDPYNAATDVASLDELVAALGEPSTRTVWTMVPAGPITEQVIGDLVKLLGDGDLVIDGGNANWRDSVRRAGLLGEHGIAFVDAGVLRVGY